MSNTTNLPTNTHPVRTPLIFFIGIILVCFVSFFKIEPAAMMQDLLRQLAVTDMTAISMAIMKYDYVFVPMLLNVMSALPQIGQLNTSDSLWPQVWQRILCESPW